MKSYCLILSFSCLLPCFMLGQGVNPSLWQLGSEVQQYPTGFLLGIHLSRSLGAQWHFESRVGYNIVRHQDFGVHEDERGGGWGGSLGVHYLLSANNRTNWGWVIGARSDLWFNEIDWKDHIGTPSEITGHTSALVLQPTLIGGYQFSLGQSGLLVPHLGFGREINLIEDGGEVGEGFILLWGFRLLYAF